MKVTDVVKNNFCTYDSYRAGFLYYTISFEDNKYRFTIPIDDVGNGTLNHTEKAITLMRWIRQAIDKKEFIKCN